MFRAAEPRIPRVGRVWMDATSARGLLPRQLAWTAVQAASAAALASTEFGLRHPDLAFGAALGLGAAAAWPRRVHLGALVALLVTSATLIATLALDTSGTLGALLLPGRSGGLASTSLPGIAAMAGGVAAGLGVTLLDGGPEGRRWHLALAGALTAGVGAWAASALVPVDLIAGLAPAAAGAVVGLVASQTLTIAGLRFREVDRIPSPRRIKVWLKTPYQAPCLTAHRLDAELGRACPDQDTRDGLGEVAAWIFRLQWTLQSLDQELVLLRADSIEERAARLAESAEAATDSFTQDRMLATLGNLDRLRSHRDSLQSERQRTEALADYAQVFLEEARAGLALARVQPGEHTPERLGDVLGRLRSYSAERTAQRDTVREVARLSPAAFSA